MLTEKSFVSYWKFFLAFCIFFSFQAIATPTPFRWQNLTSTDVTSAPSARLDASAAFDPSSGLVILFGGKGSENNLLNDVWAFDANNTAQPWTELQAESTNTDRPSARHGAAMAFDPSSGQLILFGGFTANGPINDTWNFDTSSKKWNQLVDSNSSSEIPLARGEASIAFDSCSGQLILFGGSDGKNYFADTWVFDSQAKTWTLLKAADENAPSARAGASMDFDLCSGQLILFGGTSDSGALGDTWVFEAKQKQWTSLNLAGPDSRSHASMTFYPCNGQLILFGGSNENQYFSDTWALDAKALKWVKLDFTNTQPQARANATMVFDPCNGQLILFGGANTTATALADTWTFGLSPSVPLIWNQFANNSGLNPANRYSAAMDFNPCLGQVILFGGASGFGNYFADTWAFNAQTSTWTLIETINAPSARYAASMIFAPSTGQLILFGGKEGEENALQETWSFDTQQKTWEKLSTTNSPSARSDASMTFDPCTGQIILFGGSNAQGQPLKETWAFNPIKKEWSNLNPQTSPSARFGASMTFDPCTGQLILFGGKSDGGNGLNDTWAFNAKKNIWTQLNVPSPIPPPQSHASMVFNPCIGRTILLSADDSSQENTWAFDAKKKQWTHLSTPNFNLVQRAYASIAFDPCSGQVILFGGAPLDIIVTLNDTWGFTFDFAPPQITSSNFANFLVGLSSSFKVTTTGFPTSFVTLNPSLPLKIAFKDNEDGTATLTGIPQKGTGGAYPLTLTASNGVQPDAKQSFTLTIQESPSITSDNQATFTAENEFTFKVTTTGFPKPAITHSGILPAGVNFTDNKDGTATLARIPQKGTSGTYRLSLKASNGVQPDASQSFTLTIQESPSITSGDQATFTVGKSTRFQVTTTGFPKPAITCNGPLPTGVNFTDNKDGTATLTGIPQKGTGGAYPLTLTASNGVQPDANQSFILTIQESPNITSDNQATFTAENEITFKVITTGFPKPAITCNGLLPTGVNFTDNKDGTATLAGILYKGTGGAYRLSLKASNGVQPDANQSFILTIQESPSITSGDQATFAVGNTTRFQVTTTGFPKPAITCNGPLPTGVNFTDNKDGTATLAGNPEFGTKGDYELFLQAVNQVQPAADQHLKLTVLEQPIVTSNFLQVSPYSALPNQTVTLTATITPSDYANGQVTFFNGTSSLGTAPLIKGTATLSTSFSSGGNRSLTAVYSGDRLYLPSTSEPFNITIEAVHPPHHLRGLQKVNEFATQKDYVNILTWEAPSQGPSPVGYRIYQDKALSCQITEISNLERLQFEHHRRKKGKAYTYYLVSIDELGNLSTPIAIKVKPID